ncbi:MAG: FtsX-like permease family protein, partial [Chthoniobacterales bacterium]
RDTKDSPRVVIIDQALAEQFFPGEDPIGKRLSVDAGNDEEGYVMSEIVGVAARMRFHAIDAMAPLPVIYCSLGQAQRTSLSLFVRAGSGLTSLEKPLRDAVASIDPALPVFDVRTMLDRVQETWAHSRFMSLLLLVFAGLALTLSMVGLYGVLAFNAVRRLREIGVRLALGATQSNIRALILGQGMRLLAVGLIIGLAGALALSRVLGSFLFEVKAVDPAIYAGVSLLLGVAAVFACWLPARRAARVDPIVTLRAE